MKVLLFISRFITGLVFTFSGFVKSIDPVGTEIKFHDYFEAMGLDFLMPYALFFSFLLNGAELIIGLMLLMNAFPKFSGSAALFFLIIFTPFTLWLAVANPVSDCGCFGDAVKLTNWETFWKNVILLIFVVFFLRLSKKYPPLSKRNLNLYVCSFFILIAFAFEFYNYYHLPLIDFLPFKKGVNIKEASTVPENAEHDVYETVLYYKNLKTGESKAFSVDNIPYQDTLNWAFDTTVSTLIKKGYEPPIVDFYLTDLNNEDRTHEILNRKGVSYIIVIHDFKKAFHRVDTKLNEIAYFASMNNIPFYCFTSSESSVIEDYKSKLPNNLIICTADYKMLKSMMRSNPGFVILKDAVILDKFHYIDIPDNKHLPF